MRYLLYLVVCMFIYLPGCSENPDSKTKEEAPAPVFPYPKTAAEVKANPNYVLYYKGEKSGIEYYITKVPNEEMNKYPYSDPVYRHIVASPKVTRVYVPVKGNEIVEFELGDIIIIGMQTAEEDSK